MTVTATDVTVLCAFVLGVANTIVLVAVIRSATEGSMQTEQGLPLGAALPPFDIGALDGSRLTESIVRARLLLFLGASCRPCHALARELASADAGLIRSLVIVVTGQAPSQGEDALGLLSFMPTARVARDPSNDLADRLAVPGTPFVYVLDIDGRVRAKRVSVAGDALASLARMSDA